MKSVHCPLKGEALSFLPANTCSKAFTLLPRKSDRSYTEVGEHRQSHSLRFRKCLQCGKLSVHDFPLKSSSQMVRLQLTRANSFIAFSGYTNHQFSCRCDSPCLLCVFVGTCSVHVCFCPVDMYDMCVMYCTCVVKR